jgi:hypothetical protein
MQRPSVLGRATPITFHGPEPVGLASEAALHGFRPLSFPAFPAMTAFPAFSLQLSGATRCTADETKFSKD